jgi:hypothetical protein
LHAAHGLSLVRQLHKSLPLLLDVEASRNAELLKIYKKFVWRDIIRQVAQEEHL